MQLGRSRAASELGGAGEARGHLSFSRPRIQGSPRVKTARGLATFRSPRPNGKTEIRRPACRTVRKRHLSDVLFSPFDGAMGCVVFWMMISILSLLAVDFGSLFGGGAIPGGAAAFALQGLTAPATTDFNRISMPKSFRLCFANINLLSAGGLWGPPLLCPTFLSFRYVVFCVLACFARAA